MSTVAAGKMTVPEYLAWCELPENVERRTELVDGEVIDMPPGGEIHGMLCAWIGTVLNLWCLERGGGYAVGNDTGLKVGSKQSNLRGVDVMLYLKNPSGGKFKLRMPDELPTLAVEVVSPSDRPGAVQKRVNQYLAAKIPVVWIVYPAANTVIAHKPDQPAQIYEEHDLIDGSPELPGFRKTVMELLRHPHNQSFGIV